MSDSLQSLVNRAIFFSTEMQTRFGLRIADAEWEVDFSENPRLAFTGEHPLTLTAHLIGTEADSPRTWHWGWDNVNEFPEPVVARSHEVRRSCGCSSNHPSSRSTHRPSSPSSGRWPRASPRPR